MTPERACAGCGAVLAPQSGPGRRRIYCSPACRHHALAEGGRLVVELDYELAPDGARPVGRVWSVRLRRGRNSVVVASELGRPSAEHLAAQIAAVISPSPRAQGAAID